MERKVKYDLEFKLRCVNEVLKKNRSVGSVANSNGFNESNLRKWVKFYNKYGIEGLLPRKNQSYSLTFKLEVLKTIEKNHLSLREACVMYNIPSDSTIIAWQKEYSKNGYFGLENKPKGRPIEMNNIKRKKRKSDKPLTREEELLLEIEGLRAENELLKKFNALVQAEEAKLNKRRKS